MVTRSPEPASQQDILHAAKAIHDKLKIQVKEMETALIFRLGKMLEREVATKFASLEERITDLVESFRDDVRKQVESLRQEAAKDSKWFTSLVDSINSLPIPQVSVTVPDKAIQVQQLPSQVTIPEGAIRVKVDQKPSQVNIPEGAIRVEVGPSEVHVPKDAFHITVDQPAAQVQVNVPQPRLVKKHIQYDQHGRPVQVEEQEVKD